MKPKPLQKIPPDAPLWQLLDDELGEDYARAPKFKEALKRLQAFFTDERHALRSGYLSDSALRRAYLGYYVPLNAHKFTQIFKAHGLDLGHEWVDYGCGPGTATLAALEHHARTTKDPSKAVDILLIDHDTPGLVMAERLISTYAKILNIPVFIKSTTNFPRTPPKSSALFVGNVLNEIKDSKPIETLWSKAEGLLIALEPSHRVASQKLIRFRDRLLEQDLMCTLVGPCTHTGACPLHRTKHWCHFSEPHNDARLRRMNLSLFQNPRLWLKYSYLVFKRLTVARSETWKNKYFRAIGDLRLSGPGFVAIDLCKPEEKEVLRIKRIYAEEAEDAGVMRGALIELGPSGKFVSAQPLSAAKKRIQKIRPK